MIRSIIDHDQNRRVRIVELLLTCCDKSSYCRLSEACLPPETVNCSMLMCWGYAHYGYAMPQAGPEQFCRLLNWGNAVDCRGCWDVGHLVFSLTDSSWRCVLGKRARGGVNHVGMLVNQNEVVHASQEYGTVVREPLHDFLRGSELNLRGVYCIPEHRLQ